LGSLPRFGHRQFSRHQSEGFSGHDVNRVYKADGRKLADCYTQPAELRDELTRELGPFPLFRFWGPGTSIAASRWIADAAIHIRRTRAPTLTLVYLPHLDYDLQRIGPNDPRIGKSLAEIDAVAGDLIADAQRDGAPIGEIGNDEQTPLEDRYLRRQIELAKELDLPIMIHTPHRDKKRGTTRTMDVLIEHQLDPLRCVIA
jgi:hypothetical protein